jgi:ankyrin repeat protein
MLAAVKGHIEVVEQLLVFRTDTNVQSEKVSIEGEVCALQFRNANDDCVVEQDENTALILASEQGHARVVQMLVDARALLNLQNVVSVSAYSYVRPTLEQMWGASLSGFVFDFLFVAAVADHALLDRKGERR